MFLSMSFGDSCLTGLLRSSMWEAVADMKGNGVRKGVERKLCSTAGVRQDSTLSGSRVLPSALVWGQCVGCRCCGAIDEVAKSWGGKEVVDGREGRKMSQRAGRLDLVQLTGGGRKEMNDHAAAAKSRAARSYGGGWRTR